MTATVASNDICVERTWSLSTFTFFHVSKTVKACVTTAPSTCHGWRVRPSHAKHMGWTEWTITQFATEKAARRSAFRLLGVPCCLFYLPAHCRGRAWGWRCGFGPSSRAAPFFSVSSGGDVIRPQVVKDFLRFAELHDMLMTALGGAVDNGPSSTTLISARCAAGRER
jgi:hypothetical protein